MNPLIPHPWGNFAMIALGLMLIYLALAKDYEPLLLAPIGIGMVLSNIPYSPMMEAGGFLKIIYDYGLKTGVIPILIFIGVGAMCDFSPLLSRPWLLLIAGPPQLGIYVMFWMLIQLGYDPYVSGSIAILGAMDGPTAIFVASKFAPHLLAPIALCAYSYISMIPILQRPLSKALTTRSERLIRMESKPQEVPRQALIIFPILVTILVGIVVPDGLPLIGALMLGNFLREAKALERLSRSAQTEINDASTLLLGISVGGGLIADDFLRPEVLVIFGYGIIVFCMAIVLGLLYAKLQNMITHRINPLIGPTGMSAFPMAARVAHRLGLEEDPTNFLLPYAIAANTGGQIASVIAGAVMLTYLPMFA